jgi:hypothetical protein
MMTQHDRDEIGDVIAKAVASALAFHQLGCPIKTVETQQQINTDGVNNFRKFQLDVTAKMNFVHGAAKAWSWILGLALTILLALGAWGFKEIYPAFRAIMVEYYVHHPAASLQTPQKNIGLQPVFQTYNTHMNPPQDATTAPPYQPGVTYVY